MGRGEVHIVTLSALPGVLAVGRYRSRKRSGGSVDIVLEDLDEYESDEYEAELERIREYIADHEPSTIYLPDDTTGRHLKKELKKDASEVGAELKYLTDETGDDLRYRRGSKRSSHDDGMSWKEKMHARNKQRREQKELQGKRHPLLGVASAVIDETQDVTDYLHGEYREYRQKKSEKAGKTVLDRIWEKTGKEYGDRMKERFAPYTQRIDDLLPGGEQDESGRSRVMDRLQNEADDTFKLPDQGRTSGIADDEEALVLMSEEDGEAFYDDLRANGVNARLVDDLLNED